MFESIRQERFRQLGGSAWLGGGGSAAFIRADGGQGTPMPTPTPEPTPTPKPREPDGLKPQQKPVPR